MEKRILGIVLTVLGIIGLIYAGVIFMQKGGAANNMRALLFSGILGAIFFFAGVSLIRTTQDKPT